MFEKIKKGRPLKAAIVVLCVAVIVLGSLGSSQALAQKRFEGVEITVATQTPPFIAKPVQIFRGDWERKTGGKVRLVTIPWGELYEKMYSSLVLGGKIFDVILFPGNWLADFAEGEYLYPLDDLIAGDEELGWSDIIPAYQEVSSYGGTKYTIPLDGDFHIYYYRTEPVDNSDYQRRFESKYGYRLGPPETWDQLHDMAEFLNGWDWDDDGRKEYGVVEAMRKGDHAYWFYFNRAAAYTSIPGQVGGLFFDPETMEPLINDPGHVKALKDWLAIIKKFGVPGMVNMDSGEIRSVFVVGEAFGAMDWGDIGVMENTMEMSTVKGKVGYTISPGVKRVWDYKKKEWVDFPEVNYAPYLAFTGWLGGVSARSEQIEAAWDFLSFLGSKENSYTSVTTAQTGFNPYRYSHFEKLSGWYAYGFVHPEQYLEAIRRTITHPNVQPDLRIPGSNRYFVALDAELAIAIQGAKSPQKALDDAKKEWEKITEDLGREKQLKAYRLSLELSAE